MGVMEDRIKYRVRLKCYSIKGNGEVKDIANFILEYFQFYTMQRREDYVIPKVIIDEITKRYELTYSKKELLQYIWDNGLAYIYPLDINKYYTEPGEDVTDSPI